MAVISPQSAHRRRDRPADEEHRRSRLATVGGLGLAAGAGALAEYLLDPDRGRTRQALLWDRMNRAAHDVNGGLGVLARDMGNRGRGIVAGARRRVTGRAVDDQVLHERVRAELGRFVTHPHAVELSVNNGQVTLAGDVLDGEHQRACRALIRVPGVTQVQAVWTVHRDPTGVPQLQGAGRSREPVPELLQQHWSPTARFVTGSSAAAIWVASRRLPRPLAWALRAAASALAVRAATDLPFTRLTGISAGRRAIDIEDGIVITAAPERIWPLISDYSIFPRIMPDVRDVRRAPDGPSSHWTINGPAGAPVRFDAEETKREEGRELAWKTTDGQLVAHSGRIRLDPEGDGRTRIQVQLTYNPMAGAVGHALATMLAANPRDLLIRDLQRLKSYIETGKTPSDAHV